MTLTGLLRILFRWKKVGLVTFAVIFILGGIVAILIPLKYEAQITIERKPVMISVEPLDREFDLTRLTSETQRNISLLKSRFMMEKWLAGLGISLADEKEKEKELKKLESSLTVKPVNFTDMIVIRVKDNSPLEARKGVISLTELFTDWDKEQARQQAEKIIVLLRTRMEKVKENLVRQRADSHRYKLNQSLRLSGSIAESSVETEISSKEKLYDYLTRELEEAERRVDEKALQRIGIVAEPSVSTKPIQPRSLYWALAFSVSVLMALFLIFICEWQIPVVNRAGDIFHEIPSPTVAIIPKLSGPRPSFEELKGSLGPLIEAMAETFRLKNSLVVQVASPAVGDGKTTLCEALARVARSFNAKTCILNVSPPKVGTAAGPFLSLAGASKEDFAVVSLAPEVHLEAQIRKLKESYNAIFLDVDLAPGSLMGSNFVADVDITGIVVSAGRTSRKLLGIVEQQLKRFSYQKVFYILNRACDPLPSWLRS